MTTATTRRPVTFRCSNCLHALTPPFAPPSAPNCPSCGTKMRAQWASESERMHVQCPRCHTVAEAYSSDRCPKCGGPWQGFTSQTSPAQDPQAAFRGTGVTPYEEPTANNLGPGAAGR